MSGPRHPSLFLTHSSDEHVDLVRTRLGDSVFVLHTDRPYSVWFDPGDPTSATLEQNGVTVLPSEARSVWNRRPHAFSRDELPAERFTRVESGRLLMHTLKRTVPAERWINHPVAVEAARDKLTVLDAAALAGLPIPAWTISNDAARLHDFAIKHGGVVAKPIVSLPEVLRELPNLLYAHPLAPDALDALVARGPFASLFLQEKIAKVADWRVSVIDEEVSSVRMTGCPDDVLDFRLAYAKLRMEAVQLPAPLRRDLLALLRGFGLRYAAVDFVESADGRLVFLEINPAGQFGWMERAAGYGGVADFAALLASALEADGHLQPQHEKRPS